MKRRDARRSTNAAPSASTSAAPPMSDLLVTSQRTLRWLGRRRVDTSRDAARVVAGRAAAARHVTIAAIASLACPPPAAEPVRVFRRSRGDRALRSLQPAVDGSRPPTGVIGAQQAGAPPEQIVGPSSLLAAATLLDPVPVAALLPDAKYHALVEYAFAGNAQRRTPTMDPYAFLRDLCDGARRSATDRARELLLAQEAADVIRWTGAGGDVAGPFM